MEPSPNVLVIEGGKVVRGILSNELQSGGFSITLAETGSKGLDMGLSGGYDLVIAGTGPSTPDGFDVCSRLNAAAVATRPPVILLGEDAGEESAERGFAAGASAFIPKSRIRLDLLPRVRRLLRANTRTDLTVLVIDDSKTVRNVIRHSLESLGCSAIVADSGRAALEELTVRRPDCILCDADMPDMDGAAVFQAIKQQNSLGAIPFVIMGAEQERENMRRIMGLGAAACLFKPFHATELVRLAGELRSEAFREIWTERRLVGASLDAATSQLVELVRLREDRLEGFCGHSEKTARLVRGMAEAMGLPAAEIARAELAARLHDIGRIGLAEDILLRPGKLTAKEYETVKTHSAIGAQMLSAIPSLADVVPAALHHHERMDGSGYPYRLRGADIPLLARMTATADAFEAMTSGRPYRKAVPGETAMRLLFDAKGAQCCPRCLKALAQSLGLNQSPGPDIAASGGLISRGDRRVSSAAGQAAPGALAGPKSLLVAEPHASLQRVMRQGLRKLGVEPVFVTSGEDAWGLLNKKSFEAVVLADDLPGMSGFELAAKMRWSEILAEIPCVLALSGEKPGLGEKLKALKLTGSLVKPYSVDQLWDRLVALSAERAKALAAKGEGRAIFPKELVERLGGAHEDFCAHIGRRFLANLENMAGLMPHCAEPELMDKQKDVFLAEFKPLHLTEHVMPLFDPLGVILKERTGSEQDGKIVKSASRRFIGMGMNVAFSHFRAVFPEEMFLAEKSNPLHTLVAAFRKDARKALEAFDEACLGIFADARSDGPWSGLCPPPDCSGFEGARCDLHARRNVMDAFGRGLLSPLDMRDAIADHDPSGKPGAALFPRIFCAPALKVIRTFFVGDDRYDSVNATLLELMKKYCGKEDGFAHYELRLFFSQDKVAGYLAAYILSILGILSSEEKQEMFVSGVNGRLEQQEFEGAPVFEKRHFALLTGTWAIFARNNLHRLTSQKTARKILRRYVDLEDDPENDEVAKGAA